MGKVRYPDGTTPTICIVGAGFSGIAAGIKLKTQLGLNSFTIFDENYEVGGTWLVNSYPGCACDVASHLYSFSFEPNPYFSSNYASRDEIWDYLKTISLKHGLYNHMRLNTQVKQLEWVEELRQWKVNFVNNLTNETGEMFFDLVINGPGALRVPNMPEQFTSFKGPLIHSAKWDSTIELKDKIIGIVGSGCSGVQLVPYLAENAKELHCYQRHAAWVLPKVQFQFPQLIKKLFSLFPLFLWIYRCFIYVTNELGYFGLLHKSTLSYIGSSYAMGYLKFQITNKALVRKLTPDYKIGCKRTTLSTDYFPSISRSNVYLHREPIEKVVDNGIMTSDNNLTKLDVLVLATGFKVHEYFAPMRIIGKNSVDMLSEWIKFRPTGYLGIFSSMAPNQFGLLGPNSGGGHTSVIFNLECQVNYIMQVIEEMMRRNASMITVKETEEEKYAEFLMKEMKKTVWGNEKCGSFYEINGHIIGVWPKSTISYWKQLYKPNFSHFEFAIKK